MKRKSKKGPSMHKVVIAPALIALALVSAVLFGSWQSADVRPQSTVKLLLLVDDPIAALLGIPNAPKRKSHCSGVHVGKGVVLTAAHCTVDSDLTGLRDDAGREYQATLLWQNKDYDVALIYAPELDVASSELSCRMPALGEEIIVSGHPLLEEWIRTKGVIVGKQHSYDGMWAEGILGNVTSGPGNSGGPVFDTAGNIVGLLVGGYPRSPNLSIIVPAPTICRLLGRA